MKRNRKHDDDWGLISFAEFEEMEPPTAGEIQQMQETMSDYKAYQRRRRVGFLLVLLLLLALVLFLLFVVWPAMRAGYGF